MPLAQRSIWQVAAPETRFDPLGEDLAVDVAIVGGGITGLLCAWLLSREGRRVAVLEGLRVGEGSTGNSTGNLYAPVGGHEHALADDDVAAQVWRARAEAVDRIEQIVRAEKLDCDFVRRPWITFSMDQEEDPVFGRLRGIASKAGMTLRDASGELPFPVTRAVALDGQAQFNPLSFVRGLAKRLQGANCRIHEQSRVESLEAGEPNRLRVNGRTVTAAWVILATHTPVGVLKVHAALAPYREYGIAATVSRGALPQGICWSTDPRHSLRSYRVEDRDHLVVVGYKHKVGQAEDTEAAYRELERYAAKRFAAGATHYRWSAQGYWSADGLPYVGESAHGDHVLYASGFAADGLTWAAVSAPILAAQVLGQPHPSRKLLEAGRFRPLASAVELAKENLNVLEQYLKDQPGTADADEFPQVRRGQGKTLARHGEKLAVHRDDEGRLHVVSAVCTHMQCVVRWNRAERSWDCPCHGSRFGPDGQVLEGPALAALPPRAAHTGRKP
ncbi:MAG TPA: FAD-dependent oxidoreductase [Candidatus Binatia bacterium]|nr:FAD-dependent oxidoreductase [Candidatus Binatia bacterium]